MHVDVRERRITGTDGKDKTAVLGILEGRKVHTRVIVDHKKKTL